MTISERSFRDDTVVEVGELVTISRRFTQTLSEQLLANSTAHVSLSPGQPAAADYLIAPEGEGLR